MPGEPHHTGTWPCGSCSKAWCKPHAACRCYLNEEGPIPRRKRPSIDMEELDDEEEDEESELLSPGPSLWETSGSHSPLSSGMSLVMPSVQVPASIARGRFLSLMVGESGSLIFRSLLGSRRRARGFASALDSTHLPSQPGASGPVGCCLT